MEPGIYPNMTDPDYRAIGAVSNSDLMAWAFPDREVPKRASTFGTAAHAVILEPGVAEDRIVGLEPRQRMSSYEGPEDALVLTNSDHRKLWECLDSLKMNPELSGLIKTIKDNRDKCESVLLWRDGGILCKAKVDFYTDNWLYDIKTTQKDRDGFDTAVTDYMYFVQAAHYLSGADALGLPAKQFRFLCGCKRGDRGYPWWLHEIDPTLIMAGLKTRRALLNLYARYGKETANVTG